MFSEAPDMYPRTRALYRLINLNKHQLLSPEQWLALYRLKSQIEQHLSTANRVNIIGASEFAGSRTDTNLSFSEVLTLHCTVRT